MKPEQQVCSFELAERLKSLGVRQESSFYWEVDENDRHVVYGNQSGDSNPLSAFTVAELGEMLPEKTTWRGYSNTGDKWTFEFGDFKVFADTEADARAKMLVYLKDEKEAITDARASLREEFNRKVGEVGGLYAGLFDSALSRLKASVEERVRRECAAEALEIVKESDDDDVYDRLRAIADAKTKNRPLPDGEGE